MLMLMTDADNDWACDDDVVESDGGSAAGAGDDLGDADGDYDVEGCGND